MSTQRARVSCVLMWAALDTYTGNSTFQEKKILASTQRYMKNFYYYLKALLQAKLSIPAGAHLAGKKSLKPKNYSNHAHRPSTLHHTDANSAEPLPFPIQPMKQRYTVQQSQITSA